MGAWGSGLFDDDGACDLVADAGEAGSLEPVMEALAGAPPEGYFDAHPGCAAIVGAAIVVARRHPEAGDLRRRLVDELEVPLDAIAAPTADQLALIRRSMARLLDPETSELYELWAEADPEDFNAWKAEVQALAAKLDEVG